MKHSQLKEIIKKKSSKTEFAIVTNLENGLSEIYEPGKLLNKEFEIHKEQIENFFKFKKNGIIVTIAFHSLEDNIIKNFFKPKEIHFPRDIPLNNERIITFKCIAKKIRPSNNEIKTNPRSRSAIMRVFQKI